MAAVLLVDPDPQQRAFLQATLSGAGYAPLLASSAQGAIECLREGGIDLTIVHYTDGIQMEVFSGGLARLPDPPPFLILSSAVDAPTMSARYGAVEFVAKPCGAEEILSVVQRVLAQRSTPHEFEEVPTRPNERMAPKSNDD